MVRQDVLGLPRVDQELGRQSGAGAQPVRFGYPVHTQVDHRPETGDQRATLPESKLSLKSVAAWSGAAVITHVSAQTASGFLRASVI